MKTITVDRTTAAETTEEEDEEEEEVVMMIIIVSLCLASIDWREDMSDNVLSTGPTIDIMDGTDTTASTGERFDEYSAE